MLVVCLPTYNERENLERMTRTLVDVCRDAGLDARILVIDDASPDGTGEIASRLEDEIACVEVLHREGKEGLGPAYIAGFRRAFALGATLVVTIDCDFSHDPADVPRIVAACERADLALGSRYVAGGGTRNWGPGRRAISRFGSFYARAVLGLSEKDLTGGFRCYRRTVLEGIGLDRIASKGYAFQIETAYRAIQAGYTVVELPIVFVDRVAGGSKMSHAIALEAMTALPKLRWQEIRGRL